MYESATYRDWRWTLQEIIDLTVGVNPENVHIDPVHDGYDDLIEVWFPTERKNDK